METETLNATTTPAPAPAQTEAGGFVQEKPTKKTDKVRTGGWVLFDAISHWGVGWIGNAIGAIFVANDRWNYDRNNAFEKNPEKYAHVVDKSPRPVRLKHVHKFTDWFDTNISERFTNILFGAPDEAKERQKLIEGKRDWRNYFRRQLKNTSTEVFTLAWSGHLTTLISGILDRPNIKPKLVRFFDNQVVDPVRKLFGKGPSEEELEQRKEIYEKLDNELSGKSGIGVIGARVFGIGMVVSSMTALGLIDKLLIADKPVKEVPESPAYPKGLDSLERDTQNLNRGFGRAGQLFFNLANRYKNSAAGQKRGFDPNYLRPLKDDQYGYAKGQYVQTKAQYMGRMVALEIVGSFITEAIQYTYLMAKEFFGVGVDTNIKRDKKAEPAKTAKVSQDEAALAAMRAQDEKTLSQPRQPVKPSERVTSQGESYVAAQEQQRNNPAYTGVTA
jgi:hypothetical protein